ncbi:MAG TPA: prepilin peptidase [Armatimonadota bacterium]|nr:prepilin peptidase [Armatimonadota bacterium]
MPEWLGILIAFIYGTVVGSFLNVCIWRLPRDESLVKPGSHCPQCSAPLRAWDLVPLFSFLIQARRCRYCGAPISWRYFGVELLSGLYFALAYYWFGPRAGYPHYWIVDFLAYALFGASLIAIFFIDLEHWIIPDQLSLFGIGIGLVRDGIGLAAGSREPYWIWRIPVPQSIAGILACGGVFAAIAFVSYYVFKKEAMGGGDMKLAAAVGANLALGSAMLSFLLAVFLGSVIGIALIATGRKTRKDYVPFGPMMVAGAIVAIFYGNEIIRMWLGYWGF